MTHNKEIDLSDMPIALSKEEMNEILKSCASMLGFEYDINEIDEKRHKEFLKKWQVTEEEYQRIMEFNKQQLPKARESTKNPCRSMYLGSDC